MAQRRCVQCRALTTRRTRCAQCQQALDRARNARRTHYHGDYKKNAKAIRDAANANPATRCWRCGQPARPDDPWQAGHVRDGDPTSPLAAEHRSCNATAGRRLQAERATR